MPKYTESGSFDLEICRDEINQIAVKLVGHDAIPLYGMLGRQIHLFIRSTTFILKLFELLYSL